MKTVSGWRDLEQFGIEALTGEACGLMYRILFDVTEHGKHILEKCFGCGVELAEAWNRGTDEKPHIGSIMLSNEMLIPLGIFALLESGCSEVWKSEHVLLGVEPFDESDRLDAVRRHHGEMRRFSYRGTAGDRNTHVATGRTA
ncbi:hypothetical protein [Blastopirellula marina]|uniref:hypothetical protein n=1 Tax=Blastopirellula marina TaxID=124 RepID=UPI0011AFE40E|nr:hypothetical protein [Blastopirellula marina]